MLKNISKDYHNMEETEELVFEDYIEENLALMMKEIDNESNVEEIDDSLYFEFNKL